MFVVLSCFLFINELTLDIVNDGKHGAILSSTLVKIFILLFADDIVIVSETAIGLQNQLSELYKSMIYRVFNPPCLCSTVSLLHHVYVPPPTGGFYAPLCLYSTVAGKG